MQGLTLAGRLAALRRLLAKGETLRQAEKKLRVPRSTLARWAEAGNLPRRRRGLTPEKRQHLKRLLRSKKTDRQIAESIPVSTETVWRYRHLISKFRSLIARARTPLPCRPWRCPEGGELLNVSYCIVHRCHKPPGTGKAHRS